MDAKEQYKLWTTDPYFDEETKAELKSLEGNDAEIQDRFYRNLEFGTGGLRGVIGAGTNRMNKYTVRQATQGLANYIVKNHGEDKGVAIAFDSRNFSPEFSLEAALVLNANGIKTYRFDTLRPTPELSFAVRFKGASLELMSQLLTTPVNTTATRFTGKMAHRLRLQMIQASWMR